LEWERAKTLSKYIKTEGRSVKTSTLILLFVILAFVGVATATVRGTYKILKGEEDPVCEEFLANLKALGEPALVCDRQFHPRFPQFSWPTWETLDPAQHTPLILQIWQKRFHDVFQNGRSVFEEHKKALDDILRSQALELATTRLVINGKPTTVLRFIDKRHEHLNCDWTQPLGRKYYALTEDKAQIDFETTEHSPLDGGYRPDLFLYNGDYYTAYFSGGVPLREKGWLFLRGELDFCEFEFNADKKEKTK
jgi:hypothetical protein